MAEVQGLILEAGDGWAIVLLPGGKYKKIKTRESVAVGQLFNLRNYSIVKYVAAAAIFLVILLGSLDFCRVSAWAHITPGINLGLNRWDRVISIKTNDDIGQNTITNLQLKGQSIEQAVNNIVQKQVGTPGMLEEEAELSLTLSTNGKDKARQEKLLSKIDAAFKYNGVENNPRTSTIKVIRQGNKLIVIDNKAKPNKGEKGWKSQKVNGNHYGQEISGSSIKVKEPSNTSEEAKSGSKGQVNSSSGKNNKDIQSKKDKSKADKIKSQPPGQQKKTKPDKKNNNNNKNSNNKEKVRSSESYPALY